MVTYTTNNLNEIFEKVVLQNFVQYLKRDLDQMIYASHILEYIFYYDDTRNYPNHPLFHRLTIQHAYNIAEIINYREQIRKEIAGNKGNVELINDAEHFAYGYVIYHDKLFVKSEKGKVYIFGRSRYRIVYY